MNEKSKHLELDLIELVKTLWKKVWIIILAAIIGGGAAFSVASYVITPKYESEAMMYVNNSSFSVGNTSFSISSSEISAAQSLVDTYIVILKSRTTLNKIINEAKIDYSYSELKDMIKAAPIDSTEVFSIIVTSEDPKEAEVIANAIAQVLPDRIADIVDGSSVRIVDYAIVPSEKASPNITMYTAIGMLIFAAVACLFIIVRKVTDTTIRSEEYLIQTYGIPILSVIPNLSETKSSKYYAKDYKTEQR